MQRSCSCKGSQLPRAEDASRALAIFGRLLEARDLDDRRPSHVLLVEQLATTHAQADRVTQEIETTGWVIPSPKNPEKKICNPLLDALNLIRSSQLNLTRAPALDGPPADRKTMSKKARTVVDARRTVEQNVRFNSLAGAPDGFPLAQ